MTNFVGISKLYMLHTENRTSLQDSNDLYAGSGWRCSGSWLGRSALIAGLIFGVNSAVAGNLDTLSGQTELQERMGTAVTTTCGGLIDLGTDRTGSSDTEDLLARCQDMVHTANDINGSGATAFSLGLTSSEANDALRELAQDEAVSQGTNSSDFRAAQSSAIAGRLSAIRSGARGLSVAGLRIYVPGTKGNSYVPGTKGNYRSLADLFSPDGEAGAAAGAESGNWMTEKLAAFISGSIGTGESDGSDEEAGYDVNFYSLTVGADYRFTDVTVGGLALGYAGSDSDFDNDAGSLDSSSISITAFGTTSITNDIYLQGSVGYARNDFDMSRRIVYAAVNRTAKGDTDGDEIFASVGGGMDLVRGGFTITPMVRADYLDTDIDSFTETGARGLNLQYDSQDLRSFTGAAGVEISRAISLDFGVLVPSVRLSWVHEFDDDSRLITVQYAADPNNNRFSVITDSPDRNYFDLGLSVVSVLPHGNSFFIDYGTVLGHSDVSAHLLSAGFRIEF